MGKALELYPLLYPNDPNSSRFKAGTGWLKRFKERHGIRALAVEGESQSATTEGVEPFKVKLQKIIEQKILTLNQVFNSDELASIGSEWSAVEKSFYMCQVCGEFLKCELLICIFMLITADFHRPQ